MNRSFTSNSTGLSGGDNPLIRHRHKVDPYVSPFILNAKKKAEERAKLARMKMRKNHSPSRNEWDITPVNSGLFDPTIRKQEIFRLGPRSQKNEEEEKPEHRNNNENNPQRMGTASDQKQKVSHPSSAQQIPPKLSKGVTFAKSKPVGQTRSNHFMAPKAEIKPVHEASYNHNCPLKFSNSSGGKITMKTIASVPKRTPLSTNVQKEKESGKEAQQVIEPNQEHILQQHSNSHDIISDPEHERDLLYPHSPSLQVQDHPSVVAHTFNTMIQPTSDSVAKLTLTSEPQLTALDPLHIIRPTSTAMLPQDTGLPLMIQPRNTLPISQPSFPNTTHVPPSHDPQHIETTEPLDRAQDMNGYYKQMIRDRLRALWQKHRGESASDEGEQRKIVRTKGRNKGVPFHAAPHGHDSQIYMRDMMASMAQIMTAVGEIVTSNTNSRNGKNRRRRSRSVRDLNQDAIPIVNENGQYVPSTETDNFMLEMAQAMNPHAKSNFPKRKSEVLDLVMQKLQSIERCESDIRDFLSKPVRPESATYEGAGRYAVNSQPTEKQHFSITLPPTASSNRENPRVILRTSETHPEYNVVGSFPKILHYQDNVENEEIRQFMKEMDRTRQLKEVAFNRKNSTSRITGDKVADELYDRILRSVATEFEELFEDYSENFVNKV